MGSDRWVAETPCAIPGPHELRSTLRVMHASRMQTARDSGTEPALHFEGADGLTLAADHYGDPSKQPVVLLHGGGQTRHSWGGTAAMLGERGYYAITLDHRGHGDSDWDPSGDYRLDGFARDLTSVIRQLDETPVVVGASLGGITALLVNRSDATAMKALALVDVTPRMERAGVARITDFMKGGAGGFGSVEEAADAVARYLPHRTRPKDLSGLRKNLRRTDDGRYRWHYDPKFVESWDPDRHPDTDRLLFHDSLIEAARALTIPTLLVRGRMSDVVSPETANEFLEVVPHAEYVDLEGAAHMVAGDRNDAFTDTVVSFLDRQGARTFSASI